MERAEVLMLKLLEQYRKKENPETLVQTLQQIQHELSLTNISAPAVKERNKVSVVLPYRHKPIVAEEKTAEEEKTVQVLHVDEAELEKELEMIKQAAEMKNEMGLKLRPPVQEQLNNIKEDVIPSLNQAIHFDPLDIDDIPTLATHIAPQPIAAPATDVNDSIKEDRGDQGRDLNESFRESRKEVSQKLQDVPIKDLRKAIGINDRYLYINELFNGDEAMFERSVKTLNQFSILPEAEFWIQRELRIKLGWKEDNFLVQQFVQLVRRRFS